ncbi:hypothetical protein R1T08_17345 [Streptomyces sp. SBC-4]|nr:hypothetical protein [Streptomyces sp. SBC-4]MDV5145927.1 hypothetical protein [Streptomyces sp. SBC-4]
MSDEAEGRSGEARHCPNCGKEVRFELDETTTFGSEGHEYMRGTVRCTNPECMLFGKAVRPV